jgi:lysophospholipase L1-like esterase
LLLAVAERRQTPDEGELRHRVGLDEYEANLAEMVRLARAHGAQAMLLTRPFTGPVFERHWKQFGSDYNEATVRVAEREDVPLIDVYSFFKDRDRYFGDESHFTEDGHRLAAGIVFERLEPLMRGSP